MTQEIIATPAKSFPLPDVFSHALTHMVEKVRPSIVQVLNEGRGAGTGIIWEADDTGGFIITNHHVVPEGSTTIKVHLADDRILDAKVVDAHSKFDLAMLSVKAHNLQAVTVGDSARLRVGEWVFAVGNPWGQRGVVTAGIVSSVSSVNLLRRTGARKESEQSDKREDAPVYIKSDVILAPGNSGGPLLDADGKVVGVNAMVFGGDLAVSIPSNVVTSWLSGVSRRRVTLGIEVQPVELPNALSAKTGSNGKQHTALMVVALNEEKASGAGEQTELFVGDVLLEVAGKPVADEAAFVRILARKEAHEQIPVRLMRGGTVLTLNIIVKSLERKA